MGISFSCPFSKFDDLDSQLESVLVRSISFGGDDERMALRSVSFNGRDSEPVMMKSLGSRKMILEGSISFKGRELETTVTFKSPSSDMEDNVIVRTPSRVSTDILDQLPIADSVPDKNLPIPLLESSDQRHQAAVTLQKTYKSFRTRRQLADCAVLVEQRWWKLLDFAELKRSSISFFDIDKPETAVSRWSRARTRAAKVGKGLSKDEKARKLALQHWLEAIDPRHRYGHNLQFYYAKWLHCESKQPFFYWLDIGEGKEVNVERCPRSKLQQQCIKYLGLVSFIFIHSDLVEVFLIEREAYEVEVEDGKFIYRQSGELIDTRGGPEEAKWIFVLSVSKTLYVGQKKKGTFQHSSFLAGGATLSAGRLVVEGGVLKAVWPHSGHYLPTEENFEAFMLFLEEHNVDLSIVQRSSRDEEKAAFAKCASVSSLRNSLSKPGFTESTEESNATSLDREKTNSRNQDCNDVECLHPPLPRLSRGLGSKITPLEIPTRENVAEMFEKEEQREPSGYETAEEYLSDVEVMVSKQGLFNKDQEEDYEEPIPKEKIIKRINSHKGMKSYQLAQQLSCRWTTGAGPRIGCVRDYPSELQSRVLEEVNLSPRKAFPSPQGSSTFSPRVLTPTNLCRETKERSPLALQQVIL
ncbi:unnamed protein product [Ilex paraguariensis]|uniref:Calmodulin-binding protein n=1 Tax=Ilex paraguariensis TaxID=185542 RepID=A0ABC8RM41_9AQUA